MKSFALALAALLSIASIAACTRSSSQPASQNVGAAASATNGFEVPLTPRDDVPGVPNFAKVSDVLYRGAQPTREGFVALRKLGVRTVVSLRELHSDRDLLDGVGLRYVQIPEAAWHPEDEDVAAFLKVLRDAESTPVSESTPVFVHCQHGADRTGFTVAAYRIVEQHWSNDAALKELRNFGFHEVWGDIPEYVKALDAARIEKTIAETTEPKIEVL
jgi:protein tyrosine phosphatase (PTP) superfamily phosphohydrolase (DUF442 family)